MTNKQLEDLGFIKDNDGNYYASSWDYQFNPCTNELIFFNDGFPDLEPLVVIKNYEHFKEVVEALKSSYRGFEDW